MELDKHAQLVSGRKSPKTKEKIRLKLRYLLNKYTKCVIGISDAPHENQKYYFEQQGYKYLIIVYKSSSLEAVQYYLALFRDLYLNELINSDDNVVDQVNENAKLHYIYLAGKKKKRAY